MGVRTTITHGGQITLPKVVRDELGLRDHDELDIEVIDGEARLRKARLSLADLEGIFPALDRDIDPDEAIRIAKQERATRWRESQE